MPFAFVIGAAMALAADCFAVSLGVASGARGLAVKQVLRMAALFGSFQFLMPLLGWLAGARLLGLIRDLDHWAAFGLLAAVGGHMIYGSFDHGDGAKEARVDRTRGRRLFVLAVATSIDALAVGLSLGVMGASILYPAAVIGATSFVMTIAGAKLGPVVGRVAGRRAELVGGLILIGIGVRILIEHMSG